MSLDNYTKQELQRVIKNDALEEFIIMLVDDARKYTKVCKDSLISTSAHYAIDKVREKSNNLKTIL